MRQTSGSTICPSCGQLVGVRDEKCLSCGRPNPGMWGWAPFLRALGRDLGLTKIIVAGCVALYVAMLVTDPSNIGMGGIFSMLSPSAKSMILFGASGAGPVIGYGRWWTVLSAGWLHGGILHILFNMMWIRQLAPAAAHAYGPGRTLIVYTASCASGFLMSSMAVYYPRLLNWVMAPNLARGGAQFPLTLGASAPLFGLLGALIVLSRRTGSRTLGQQVWGWAAALFVFGLVMRGVDNWAHLGGFLGGYVVARWLDPLQPERGDHLLIGLVCLVATALSVVVSIVTGLRILPSG